MAKSDKEWLIEAKAKYPVGTTFKCTWSGKIHTISSLDEYMESSSGPIVSPYPGNITGCYLHQGGRWSEIINPVINIEIY